MFAVAVKPLGIQLDLEMNNYCRYKIEMEKNIIFSSIKRHQPLTDASC